MGDPQAPRPAYTRDSTVLRLPGVASLEELSPEWAWGGATGKGVRVAVVDSGVTADHPALDGCVDADGGLAVTVEPDGSTVDHLGPHDDAFRARHRSRRHHPLAGTGRPHHQREGAGIGARGQGGRFLRGLGWAIEQGFDVINLSLGTTRRDWALAFYEVCDTAYFRNCFLVTAANNVTRPSFPSLYGSVTSVACNLTTDPFRFHYNPDPPTEFLARGIDVDLAWRGGGRMTGTGNSYSAPDIAGMAALIRSKQPDLRPFQVKTVLWATAANVREARGAVSCAGRLSQVMRPATTSVRATSALRPDAPGRVRPRPGRKDPGRRTISVWRLGGPGHGDAGLVHAVLAGDTRAFAALYAAHVQAVRTVVKSNVTLGTTSPTPCRRSFRERWRALPPFGNLTASGRDCCPSLVTSPSTSAVA